MSYRRWHDNWWMGWIFAIIWGDALRAFGLNAGQPDLADWIANVIIVAFVLTISYRGRVNVDG